MNKPLSSLEFQLLVLCKKLRNADGRQIAAAYNRAVGWKVPYGSLYTTLRRLNEGRLISKMNESRSTQDKRKIKFIVTKTGQLAITDTRKYFKKLSAFKG